MGLKKGSTTSGAAEKWIVRTHQASYRSAMQIVVTLDCVDTEAQANFWLAALTPLDYRRGFHGPPYLSLVGPAPAPTLLLQHVPEPAISRSRISTRPAPVQPGDSTDTPDLSSHNSGSTSGEPDK
ncbi:hypothetical protein GCM10018966_026410 [Streptomyces yanii]